MLAVLGLVYTTSERERREDRDVVSPRAANGPASSLRTSPPVLGVSEEVPIAREAVEAVVRTQASHMRGRTLCGTSHRPVAASIEGNGRIHWASSKDGSFRLPVQDGAMPTLRITAPGYQEREVVPAGDDAELGDILLQPIDTARILVVDVGRVPVVGASVVIAEGGEAISFGRTGPGGLLDLPIARSTVVYAHGGDDACSSPALLFPREEAVLVLDATATRVEARSSAGDPWPGLELSLSRRGDGIPLTVSGFTGFDGAVPRRLPPGMYMVESATPGVDVVRASEGTNRISSMGAEVCLRASGPTVLVTAQSAFGSGIRVLDASTDQPLEAVTLWLEADYGEGRERIGRGVEVRARDGFVLPPFRAEALDDAEATFSVGVVSAGYERASASLPLRGAPEVVRLKRTSGGERPRIVDSDGAVYPHRLSCFSAVDGLLLWEGTLDPSGMLPVAAKDEPLRIAVGPHDRSLSVDITCKDSPCTVEVPTGSIRVHGWSRGFPLECVSRDGIPYDGSLVEDDVLFSSLPVGRYALLEPGESDALGLEMSRGGELPVEVARGVETVVERHPRTPRFLTGKVVARGIDAERTFVVPIFGSEALPAALRGGARRYPVDASGNFRLDPADARAPRIGVGAPTTDGVECLVGVGSLEQPIEVCVGYCRLTVEGFSGLERYSVLWQPSLPGGSIGLHTLAGTVGESSTLGPFPCGPQSIQLVGGHVMRVLPFEVSSDEPVELRVDTEKQ